MDLPQIPLLSMLKERMTWLSQRQDVLSQNIANADTPGYTARDLKPADFARMLQNVTSGNTFSGLMTDDPRHIAISTGQVGFENVDSPDVNANPTGNSVSLEEEMIKVADTQAQFQAATNLYSKAMNMMRTAIGH